jgi:hypothetical protein
MISSDLLHFARLLVSAPVKGKRHDTSPAPEWHCVDQERAQPF